MSNEMYDQFETSSLADSLTALRTWRENNLRRSDEVVAAWECALEPNVDRLGKEKHVLLEQVIFGALDCHRFDVAEKCINVLSAEFPGSLRVHRYCAMKLEAMERYDEALDLLDSLIKQDETNAAPRKRRVAIFKATGKIQEAIKELTEYLKKFMSDVEAWQELCDLYLGQGEYAKAVFCAEELLLHQPHSHLFYQRVADIRYTMGGIENMELAKTYYCQAIQLNSHNMRAHIGLFLACNNLLSQYKSGSAGKKKCTQLAAWAAEHVKKRYRSLGDNLPVLEGPKKNDRELDYIDGIADSLSALTVG